MAFLFTSKKKDHHTYQTYQTYLLKIFDLPAIYKDPKISMITAIIIPTLANIQKHPANTS